MPSFHGNSKKNPGQYHLYEIIDKEFDAIFKYGISGDSIDKDGLSARVRDQVDWANLIAGWKRFFARIILKDIPGNAKAREKEDEYIEQYFVEHGEYPLGNRDRKKK